MNNKHFYEYKYVSPNVVISIQLIILWTMGSIVFGGIFGTLFESLILGALISSLFPVLCLMIWKHDTSSEKKSAKAEMHMQNEREYDEMLSSLTEGDLTDLLISSKVSNFSKHRIAVFIRKSNSEHQG